MRITYDPVKNAFNIAKHGVSFEDAYAFDFLGCHTLIDARYDYGEVRYIATGYFRNRLHVLCYTERSEGIRAISFRPASAKERGIYEERKKSQATDE